MVTPAKRPPRGRGSPGPVAACPAGPAASPRGGVVPSSAGAASSGAAASPVAPVPPAGDGTVGEDELDLPEEDA